MVEPETLFRLKAIAETRDLPVSVIVREALSDYLSLRTGEDQLIFSNVVRRRNLERAQQEDASPTPGARFPRR